ncbi:MAG: DUF72 domain-containing protein, partial [Candidatus Competibacteraceae bacterium]|nr:DUF72 domain-containing protein [Candidatus Competibacteraceae bacterium]
AEKALNRLLVEHRMDRVMLDSRALFSATATDNDTRDAQRRKPRLPVHAVALGPRPLIRFIGHPELSANQPFLEPWIDKVSSWIKEGRKPFIFLHTPNNHYAPELAKLFHELLREQLPQVGMLPPWPITAEGGNEQLGLFG